MFGVLLKINPFTIIAGHFGTFGNAVGRGKWKDGVLFYAVPILVAFFVSKASCQFKVEQAANNSVTVLSIFVPLAFSVLLELVSLLGKDNVRENPKLELLARHLFWNVSYGILAAMVTLCGLVLVDFISIQKGHWFVFAFVAIALHFFLTALMVVKRFAILMNVSISGKK